MGFKRKTEIKKPRVLNAVEISIHMWKIDQKDPSIKRGREIINIPGHNFDKLADRGFESRRARNNLALIT
jgi:hypothetical protein